MLLIVQYTEPVQGAANTEMSKYNSTMSTHS